MVLVNVKDRVKENACDLSLSGLSIVPVKDIASFKRVNILDLSSNRIVKLGKNFTTLTRLVRLDLSKNLLKSLPEEFGLLCNLRHLVLYDNKIEYLPLSFGDLKNLRYLDLKGNPLMPALMKVVGLCSTAKECKDSAKHTVTFLNLMQTEAKRARQEYQLEIQHIEENKTTTALENQSTEQAVTTNEAPNENLKANKKSKKKSKPKKKINNNNNNNNSNNNHNNDNINDDTNDTENNQNNQNNVVALVENASSNKAAKVKKSANMAQKQKQTIFPSTALRTIFLFVLLLAINMAVIYLIMFYNPHLAELIVEYIPQQYRDWILSKTEIFRLRVSDWISEFRTPPEEQ